MGKFEDLLKGNSAKSGDAVLTWTTFRV